MRKETEAVDVDTGLEDREDNLRNQAEQEYNEAYYTDSRPEWVTTLYFQIDKCILGLRPGEIRKEYLQTYIKYSFRNILCAYILIAKSTEKLRLWVKIPYKELGSVPLFVRDYSSQNKKPGVLISFDDEREYRQNSDTMLRVVSEILEKALARLNSKKRRFKTPLTVKTNPVPELLTSKIKSVKLDIGEDGYVEVRIRCHKGSLTNLLEKII